MSVVHINSLNELNKILESSKDKLTVIDFHATWCGPCIAFSPTFEGYPKQYPSVNFLKCDVDAASEVARKYSVTAMPTFVFLKGSTKVDQVRGANRSAVESAIRKYMAPGAFSGKGQTLGGSNGGGDAAPPTDVLGGLDPQVKTLLAIVGVYLLFWYFSS